VSGVPRPRHVVVVGAGIAGLAAAEALHRGDPTLQLTVLEASGRVGGKLAVGELAGVAMDTGAESLLARRPEALDLARAVGLGAAVVSPTTSAAGLWTGGRLQPLPRRTVLGVPTDAGCPRLRRVLGPTTRARLRLDAGRGRLAAERGLLGPTDDVAIGGLVKRRLGAEVVDRLVEPLLGGVYAGDARRLSLAMTAPGLLEQLRRQASLVAAARATLASPTAAAPVFAGLQGGVGRLAPAVAGASGAQVGLRSTVRALERTARGWRLVCGPVPDPLVVDADGVVLAVPAAPAARLLAPHAPAAAARLGAVDYASVALVTLALPEVRLRRPLRGSGVLVPPAEHRVVKAVTYSSAKWAWLARSARPHGLAVLRASVGRHGETHALQRDDADLVHTVRDDLADLLGLDADPVASLVTRWGGALPQYAPGHLDLVDEVRRSVARLPGLAVCGAAYDGVGVPACIASGQAAAKQLLAGRVGAGRDAAGGGRLGP
jgi:protoporphyrinogen/coproporphyrinogen III oxidase